MSAEFVDSFDKKVRVSGFDLAKELTAYDIPGLVLIQKLSKGVSQQYNKYHFMKDVGMST